MSYSLYPSTSFYLFSISITILITILIFIVTHHILIITTLFLIDISPQPLLINQPFFSHTFISMKLFCSIIFPFPFHNNSLIEVLPIMILNDLQIAFFTFPTYSIQPIILVELSFDSNSFTFFSNHFSYSQFSPQYFLFKLTSFTRALQLFLIFLLESKLTWPLKILFLIHSLKVESEYSNFMMKAF